jgi:hypothetical protein
MTENSESSGGGPRNILAYGTMLFAALAITVLAAIVIHKGGEDPKDALTVFNIVLPVFASWVGTILAFYFGRENFESANQQVRQIVRQLTPEEVLSAPVTAVMRRLSEIDFYAFKGDDTAEGVTLETLKETKMGEKRARWPILSAENHPMYLIHKSSIESYIAEQGQAGWQDTLQEFLSAQEGGNKLRYGLNEGFVVVSEQARLAEAKKKMEDADPCQDIFVTKSGSDKEPLTGWITNDRLIKYLAA